MVSLSRLIFIKTSWANRRASSSLTGPRSSSPARARRPSRCPVIRPTSSTRPRRQVRSAMSTTRSSTARSRSCRSRNSASRLAREGERRMKFTGTCLISALLLAAAPAVHAVAFGAFADIRYDGDSANGSRNAFALGQFDLYATQKIDDKTRVFVEYVFEDPGDGFVVDLERLSITRTINPHFSIGAGRFHTPIGYWNTAYHHGALIQDTVSRPSFLDFAAGAGAILPMHVVGLMAMGQFDAGGGKLHYDLAVANGSSINTDPAGFPPEIDVNNSSAPNEQKSVMLHLSYFFPQWPMRLGVFGMPNTIAESGDIANGAVTAFGSGLVKQTLYGFDARYATSRIEALGEFYFFGNDDKVGGTGSHDASAYFLQFGYRVTDKLKPIYRYEYVDFTADDTNFQYFGI